MAAGFPAKATFVDGNVYSASDVNDLAGTLNLIKPTAKGDLFAGSAVNVYTKLGVGTDTQVLAADSTTATGLAWVAAPAGAPIVAGKNGLLNGSFQFWQRGTTSSGNAYLADRWYSALISGTGTFAQESTVVPSGSLYSQKFTVTAIAQPALYQAIETQNAIRFAGQTVTVSAKVAASTSTGFTADVQYSTATDNSVTGTWTSITATSGGTATATSTTFVNISGVYAIPSTAKSLRVRLFTTSTIAVSAVVYFGQAQIEQGTSATTFSIAMGTVAGELLACQRYYWRSTSTTAASIGFLGWALATGTTGGWVQIPIPVPMRVAPTLLEGSAVEITNINNTYAISSLTLQASSSAPSTGAASFAATGLTLNGMYFFRTSGSGGYISFGAEL